MAIGDSQPRLDGRDKVTGATRYIDDELPEGCLLGATVRSSIPHGRVKAIHLPDDLTVHGLVIAGPSDIPGRNVIPFLTEDLPLLAEGLVRHVQEPLLLVAGTHLEEVQAFVKAVRVEYEPLPAVLTLEEALASGGAQDCQVPKPVNIRRGDLEAGFQAADVVVEGTYVVGHQEHVYLETNGMIAWWEPNGAVVVKGSMQCPYYVHRGLKSVFGLQDSEVRVIAAPTGGAFGGKEDFPSVLAGHAALLARKAGRPVKLVYGRTEDFTSTTKRHPAQVRYRMGVKRDGTFTACQAFFDLDGGAYITMSPVVQSRGAIHASGPYYYPAIEVNARTYATHTAPNGAFRGFGVPQVVFGIERHVDKVARVLGLDPVEVRRRNLLTSTLETATGQELGEGATAERVLEDTLSRFDYEKRRAKAEQERQHRVEGAPYRGVGISLYMHGAGFTGSGEARLKSHVGLDLLPGGELLIRTASTDMGQGTLTVFPQIAAAVMGIPLSQVVMAPQDTLEVPDSGPTVASRTVTVVGRVVELLSREMRSQVLLAASRFHGGRAEDYVIADGSIRRPGDGAFAEPLSQLASRLEAVGQPLRLQRGYQLNPSIKWDDATHRGDAYPVYSWGCTAAEVEVDPDTLEVKITRLSAVHDIGTVIHPVLAGGQVEGGIAQAIGYGLMEEVKWERGRMLNPNFTNYIIPTSLDTPPLEVAFVENPFKEGPFGAKGVGELPMNGAAPALANAVSHALGIEVSRLPVTPERILSALRERELLEEKGERA